MSLEAEIYYTKTNSNNASFVFFVLFFFVK